LQQIQQYPYDSFINSVLNLNPLYFMSSCVLTW
jgi:hypothetical protein